MIIVLLFIFVVLQIADCFTTIYILGKNGKELNPVLAKLFDWIGVWQGLIVIKSIAIAIVLVGTKLLPIEISYWLLGLGDVIYTGVVSVSSSSSSGTGKGWGSGSLFSSVLLLNFRK